MLLLAVFSWYFQFMLLTTTFFFISNCLVLVYLEKTVSVSQFSTISLVINILVIIIIFSFFTVSYNLKEDSCSLLEYIFIMVHFIAFLFILNWFVINAYFFMLVKLTNISMSMEYMSFLSCSFNLMEQTSLPLNNFSFINLISSSPFFFNNFFSSYICHVFLVSKNMLVLCSILLPSLAFIISERYLKE